ncbi:Rnf-Nqr domain containing protein [Pseudomonas xantholysinigenes]|uniref:Electron transporter RnfA n=1 Tax=Pseudomonas xantholysinigenes TaxID=2745490 RepID=A0A9E6PY10_9PSED|nr:Rnf-Nqr domain containing protein [Pseudomonas xantholysinigenes]QXI39587.1 electron transporter RnfA [Pseudomonas xantholysinigenes]
MSDYILVLVSAALVNHLALQTDPVDRARVHASGLCGALLILLALPIGLLLPAANSDLQLLLFLPLLAALAWALPKLLGRWLPTWPLQGLQPLLMGNAVVLGLLLQQASEPSDIGQTLLYGLVAGLGFWLALALFADLRARSRHPDLPRALHGLPIELIGAGVMAMAFSGLNGLFT